jgi:RND family efflux transporter MFP subunit
MRWHSLTNLYIDSNKRLIEFCCYSYFVMAFELLPSNSSRSAQFSRWMRVMLENYRRQPRRFIAYGIAGIVVLGSVPLVIAQLSPRRSESAEAIERPILPVETITVQPVSSYEVSRTYTGEIAAIRSSDLGFERSGELVQILVREGDRVQAGQPLARLDIQTLQTQVRQLEAQKAEAQARLLELQRGPRQEDIAAAQAAVRDVENQLRLQEAQRSRREYLYNEGAISREELDEFAFGADVLEARLDQARSNLDELLNGTRPEPIAAQQAVVQQLDARIAELNVTITKSTIVAPFDGIVASRQVDEGTVVSAGQTVIRFIENAAPEARIGMPVRQVERLEIGSVRQVTLGSETFDGTVTSILPEIDPATRTRTVVLTLDAAALPLVNPGQVVQIDISEPIQADGYWLPTEALTQGIRGLWMCYVLTQSEEISSSTPGVYELQQQSVEIIHQESNRAFVRGTLQPGDRIVVSGVHRLVPGQWVRSEE